MVNSISSFFVVVDVFCFVFFPPNRGRPGITAISKRDPFFGGGLVPKVETRIRNEDTSELLGDRKFPRKLPVVLQSRV